MAQPASRAPRADDAAPADLPSLDPSAIEEAYRRERARRRAKNAHQLHARNSDARFWVMLAVAVPLGRAVPALYRWRVRSRVFRWYARLKQIELQLEENPGRTAAQVQRILKAQAGWAPDERTIQRMFNRSGVELVAGRRSPRPADFVTKHRRPDGYNRGQCGGR